MKKLLSVILAAACTLAMSSTVLADEAPTGEAAEKKEAATFTFDTDACYSYIHTFGNASDTNLTYSLSDSGAVSGRCLKLEEDFASDIGNQYGGIYFLASDFGIDSFAGYTMTVNLKTNSKVSKATDSLLVFTDGAQWVSTGVSTTGDTGKWVKASVSVPMDKANSKLGISIPITEAFSGEVMYLDEIVITDSYGNQVANIGDLDTSLAEAPGTFSSVMTTIVFILLILVVVGGVAFIVLKVTRRYR